jgi:hypothetical protein
MNLFSIRSALAGVALCAAALGSVQASPVDLNIGTANGGGCCTNATRGYWFTAPVDFRITAVSVSGAGGKGSTLEVLRFNSAVPTFSNSTNDFSSLGFWADVSSASTDIDVHSGDIIGVLGYSGGDSRTPYGNGPFATDIDGHAITLRRLGFQSRGTAHDVWNESGSIGFIGLQYDMAPRGGNVPEPSSVALVLAALAGLTLVRRRQA